MAPKTRARQSESARMFQRAKKIMPGGCSRNTILREPHPIYAAKGNGCYLTDIDGKRYIDFSNNMSSLIHGHAHPIVVDAVTKQLKKGAAFSMATDAEIAFAEHMCSRGKTFDQIRFMNSGTEAVMSGIKAARAYTLRPKIAKFEGSYHGLYDYAEVSQTSNPTNWGSLARPKRNAVAKGTPRAVLSDVVVLPFNDTERAEKILDRHAEKLACVLVDPIPLRAGLVSASSIFLKMLRQWTRKNGALLLFDEVVTFRVSVGGAQEAFNIRPDLTAMGKIVGGGFPIGALAGSRKVMSVMDPENKPLLMQQSGTFSANPISMTAGRAAMEMFDAEAIQHVNNLGDRLKANLRTAANAARIPISIAGHGSMFRFHMKERLPQNYREACTTEEESKRLASLLDVLLEQGYFLIGNGTGMLSTPMTEVIVDRFAQQCLDAFRQIKRSF